jgi:pre-mRNA-splicing factor ATP-dependent RNA helicase DHX38/PRP16
VTISAAKSFGKFKDSFLAELHSEILSHAKQEATGHVPQTVAGITVHDSEVLEPDPVRQGGLVREGMVSWERVVLSRWLLTFMSSQQHTFRKPAGPIEPPTPRRSLLGLDTLAKEKRSAAAQEGKESKKPRLEDDGPVFKGESIEFDSILSP